jgi:hypothetical protein
MLSEEPEQHVSSTDIEKVMLRERLTHNQKKDFWSFMRMSGATDARIYCNKTKRQKRVWKGIRWNSHAVGYQRMFIAQVQGSLLCSAPNEP